MSSCSASARVHAMHANCALLVSRRSVCRCIDHHVFACLCMRGCGRKLVAIQTEAHACQEQNLAVCLACSASVTQSAQPTKSECACSSSRLAAKTRWCPTFLAIVLTSSSNMTRGRSAAVSLGGGSRPGVGLVTACLGLDCHEFSSAPLHANPWSTRFLPGQMFPARAQTSTAGTGSIRLAGWCPHTVCYQPPGHCQSCTLESISSSIWTRGNMGLSSQFKGGGQNKFD